MSNKSAGRWTKEEHDKFVEGLHLYGREWKKVAKLIPTRTVVQIRTHAQKYFQKLMKEYGPDAVEAFKANPTTAHRISTTMSDAPKRKRYEGDESDNDGEDDDDDDASGSDHRSTKQRGGGSAARSEDDWGSSVSQPSPIKALGMRSAAMGGFSESRGNRGPNIGLPNHRGPAAARAVEQELLTPRTMEAAMSLLQSKTKFNIQDGKNTPRTIETAKWLDHVNKLRSTGPAVSNAAPSAAQVESGRSGDAHSAAGESTGSAGAAQRAAEEAAATTAAAEMMVQQASQGSTGPSVEGSGGNGVHSHGAGAGTMGSAAPSGVTLGGRDGGGVGRSIGGFRMPSQGKDFSWEAAARMTAASKGQRPPHPTLPSEGRTAGMARPDGTVVPAPALPSAGSHASSVPTSVQRSYAVAHTTSASGSTTRSPLPQSMYATSTGGGGVSQVASGTSSWHVPASSSIVGAAQRAVVPVAPRPAPGGESGVSSGLSITGAAGPTSVRSTGSSGGAGLYAMMPPSSTGPPSQALQPPLASVAQLQQLQQQQQQWQQTRQQQAKPLPPPPQPR